MSPSKKTAGQAKARASAARAELGDLPAQLAAVAKLTGAALVARYTEVLGAPPKSKNQQHLRKRIAIELQLKAKGGLSEDEKAHIKKVQEHALAKGLWPRIENGESRQKPASAPEPTPAPGQVAAGDRDPRLPPVGATLVREHGNAKHHVKVLAEGFEYRGKTYRSLSAIAREVTGTTWNGWLWFGLTARKEPK